MSINEPQTVDTCVAKIRELQAELLETKAELARTKDDYEGACSTVAKMHAAAVGEVRGPTRGVIEDIADLRACKEELFEFLVWLAPCGKVLKDHAPTVETIGEAARVLLKKFDAL